jgi:hypothetical protein
MIEKAESRRIRVEIRNVLMDVWDPIGVKDLGAPRDEYDGYIGKIYGLLTRGAPDEEIAQELLRIERERMELSHPGSTIDRTVAALRTVKFPKDSK